MDKNSKVQHKKTSEKRLDYIDSTKGIGSILVIIGHHLMMADSLIMWINSFHMPLFFMLTGFLSKVRICSTPQGNSELLLPYILRKLKTLIYPYVTFSVINYMWYLLFHGILGFTADESISVVSIRMLTTYGYHALWFLPAMFFASILSFWCERKGWFRPLGQVMLIMTGTILAFILNETNLSVNTLWYILNYISRIIIGIAFIGIGKYLFLFFERLDNRLEWYVLLTSFVISVSFFRYLPDISLSFSRIGNPLFFYPVACSGSILVLLLCKKTLLGRSRFLKFLGKNSIIILALHMDIPIQIAWIFVGATGLSSVLSAQGSSVCAIAIELVILCCMIVFINRFMPYLLHPPVRRSKCTNTK